jgi:hypothetical protein
LEIHLSKSEKERREHLAEQEQIARERGFIPYAEYQKNLAKDKFDKLIQEVEKSAESCNTQLPYNVPLVVRHLNRGIIEEHIDKSAYDTMIERIILSTDKFEKKCYCSGQAKAPIREMRSEELADRLKLLKDSVESCKSDTPSMAFMASKSLGVYDGYTLNGPYRITKGLREILNIAVEFKGCSCKRR